MVVAIDGKVTINGKFYATGPSCSIDGEETHADVFCTFC